jgi:hypothetical protein
MKYWGDSNKYRVNINRGRDGIVSSIELYDKRQNKNVAHVLPFNMGIATLFQHDLTRAQMEGIEKLEEEWKVNARGKGYDTLRDEIVEAVKTKEKLSNGLYKYIDLYGDLTKSERMRLTKDPKWLAVRRQQ